MARGALVFKGDAAGPKKKSTRKKHSKKDGDVAVVATKPSGEEEEQQQQQTNHSILPPIIRPQQKTADAAAAAAKVPQEVVVPSVMKEGTGRITTSGTVVTGVGTLFDRELNQGDAIIIGQQPYGDASSQEMRVVTMRLSNTSCAISSSFSENCKVPTPFYVIPKPRNKEQERRAQLAKEQQEKVEMEQQAFGTYQGSELVYREKTEHGNYRIKRVQVEGSTTRGDLLHMRAQKKSDKYC